jgi:uncharacterized coiled-coil protein SlyX
MKQSGMKPVAFIAGLFLVCVVGAAEGPTLIDSLNAVIGDLQAKVKKQEAAIEYLQAKMLLLRKELKEKQKENARLIKLCQKAGVYTGKPGRRFPRLPLGKDGQPLGFTRIEAGTIGWVNSVRVQQIIDANNAIVHIAIVKKDGTLTNTRSGYLKRKVWLKGVDTTGAADRSAIDLNCLCQITGTKSYMAVTGAQRTIFVMEPVGGDGSIK